MVDIESVKNIVQKFAEKYNFVQEIDIDNAEAGPDRDTYITVCNKIDGKKYVFIDELTYRNDIVFGTIDIRVDKEGDEDKEMYSIEPDELFSIKDVENFSDADALLEAMIEKCKKHKLLE